MKDFKKLAVWNKAHLLALATYKATANFPKEEIYGLTSQMRRSATSIPTNIAEGCGRGSDNELTRFLYIAMGSASELEYQLILVRDLEFIPPAMYAQLDDDLIVVKRMLNAFIQKLKANG